MERIKLDKHVREYMYNYSDYSKEYHTVKNMLFKEKEKLKMLETRLKIDNQLDILWEKYMSCSNQELSEFIFLNPLFNAYIHSLIRIRELAMEVMRLAYLFNVNGIIKYKECNHVFGLIDNKITCLNCYLNQEDLDIKTEEELETFKEIIKLRHRYVGEIKDEEMAYLNLIYDQRIEEFRTRGLKK